MILIINLCKEKLHYFEFVKPIEDILKNAGISYLRKDCDSYEGDFSENEKIIICGTSLKDNDFLKNFKKFEWIRNCEVPILGICGGMQIFGLVFGGKLEKKTEVGFFYESFVNEFLGVKGNLQVYHLHNNFVNFSKLNDFEVFCGDDISQAVKHKEKEIYGVLFHPEVRNKNMILEFVKR